jgi:PPOX class probable F420-dependent enzyme
MPISDGKYILFTTYRRDGTPVSTPTWVVPLEGHTFGFYTSSGSGKAKRLAHTERVTVQPSNGRGKVKEDTQPMEATARLSSGPEVQVVWGKVKAKYGFLTKITKLLGRIGGILKRKRIPYGDRAVIVTPTPA